MYRIIFVVLFLSGVWLSSQRPYGVVYVSMGDKRTPAAVGRKLDLSQFQGVHLFSQVNAQLIGASNILKENNKIGLELGQFVTQQGQFKVLTCSVYESVELVFQAEGEAQHGELPKMVVQGPCRNSTEPKKVTKMKPIWIPFGELLRNPTSTSQIDFYDDEPVSLRFSNIGESWPTKWLLTKVILHDEERMDQPLEVDQMQIRKFRPSSILIEFEP